MAVKVTNANKVNSVTEHERGVSIEVRDGHLFVGPKGDARPIAVYAPSTWISAEVTE